MIVLRQEVPHCCVALCEVAGVWYALLSAHNIVAVELAQVFICSTSVSFVIFKRFTCERFIEVLECAVNSAQQTGTALEHAVGIQLRIFAIGTQQCGAPAAAALPA